jgi:hypothetical protein
MRRNRTKFLGGFALFLLCSWVAGCASLNPGPRRENFAPLFIYSEDEENGGKAFDGLGPFFTYRQSAQEQDIAFRPLFYWKEEITEYKQLEYLYPLGKYIQTDREVNSYLMPFFSTRRDLTEKTNEKKERGFLLAFWGETDQGESYGGFFPIYGNLKNRFKRDEINFFLWPIYSDSREGESKTHTVLWPFFTYSHGGGREGFRAWPLFGYDRKENNYEKSFFLWPIFHNERRHLYTDDPTEINMMIPFYVSVTSSKRVNRSVIWPFFNYTRDEDTNYTQWDFPWPFVQWGSGDERSIFRIFPLYGRKYWEGMERGYILWPLYWYVHDEDDLHKKTFDRYLLFSKDEVEIWKKEDKQERRLRIWPFFYYRHEKEGDIYLYWPALLPFDHEGFERNWNPIFTLYEYRRNAQGASESKFLWGFYVHRQNSTRELYELSFFFTYYTAENVAYFSLLKGLLEYRGDGGKHALRVLYSPWPIEWEHPLVPLEVNTEGEEFRIQQNKESNG